jgi:hypothetical protein
MTKGGLSTIELFVGHAGELLLFLDDPTPRWVGKMTSPQGGWAKWFALRPCAIVSNKQWAQWKQKRNGAAKFGLGEHSSHRGTTTASAIAQKHFDRRHCHKGTCTSHLEHRGEKIKSQTERKNFTQFVSSCEETGNAGRLQTNNWAWRHLWQYLRDVVEAWNLDCTQRIERSQISCHWNSM